MEFRGSVEIAAEQTAVWQTLTTPTIISQCTPRLSSWVSLEAENKFQLNFTWGSGKSVITIPLRLSWQSVIPPTTLTWQGQAFMGSTAVPLNGSFHLTTSVKNQTNLTFQTQITPPNKLLAQMIQNTAPPLIQKFLSCLKETAQAV